MSDPSLPTVHLRPRSGWVNDPNGPFRWNGRYHVFFQHNPAGPLHGDICWGHASSADLVRWEHHPEALCPTAGGPDSGGCWSGCVVDDGGTPTAVYSALVEVHAETTVCLAYAEDDGLVRWRKEPEPVLRPPAGQAWLGFRDPFLLTVAGHRYALVGGGTADGGGVVSVFGCDDLRQWVPLGPLLTLDDPVAATVADAEIWECPQLVEVDGRWVLLLSLVKDDALTRVVHLTGTLHGEGPGLRYVPDTGGLVDHGHDFYAPAVLVEPERVLLWGWSGEDRPQEDVEPGGWAGVLTWPRVLGLDGAGRLLSRPAPELEGLRGSAERHLGGLTLPDGPTELLLRLGAGEALVLDGLRVAVDGQGRVRTERAVHAPHRRAWPTEGPARPTPVALRVVVDGSLVEVHAEGGPTFTERVYPRGPRRLVVESPAPVPVTAYRLDAPR